MGKSAFIVRDGEQYHRTIIADRDIGLLSGPLFAEGVVFSFTFGFYENFTLSGGIPKGSRVIRPGRNLFNAAFGLRVALERDIDLLHFDYSFTVGNDRARKGPESVVIRGRNGIVATTPKGFCYAELMAPRPSPGRIAEIIDLRIVENLVTDDSRTIKAHRKVATVLWTKALPPLLEFLRPRVRKRLIVEHIDRAE